jgi:hypothetical protein
MKKFTLAVLISIFVSGLAISFSAQTKKPAKKNARITRAAETPTISPTPAPTPEDNTVNRQAKKNERPANGNSSNNAAANANAPNYFYEFSQPAFVVSKIQIEHDETGKGKISFLKNVSSELITDPIQLSPATLERIKNALAALDFMNSTESYQYEKDYSHLGNMVIKVQKDGRTRETKFNWTQNKDAKALADEYRKIGNQYIWMFDMNLSRENQPLEAPKLMDAIDGYLERNEISDPEQLIPFLKELGDDERIPLIARNHATRLIKQIEKQIEKAKK